MIKFTVWNVDRARPVGLPCRKVDANKRADELETRNHRPYIVLPV
jgi:hypothetical protein